VKVRRDQAKTASRRAPNRRVEGKGDEENWPKAAELHKEVREITPGRFMYHEMKNVKHEPTYD
jgi:hypothetical protein